MRLFTLLLAVQAAAAPGCCTSDAQCQDGIACNGFERCVFGSCSAGDPVVCDDGLDCTVDTCREPTGACFYTPNDSACDDGALCNGAETCNPSTGCVPGTPWDCADGIDCTDDLCLEPEPPSTTPSCNYVPRDERCQNDVFCDGAEACILGVGCQPGTPPTCDDAVACTHDACDPELDACSHAPDDAVCDDSLWCNGAETCDVTLGCQAGTPPDCDDAIGCTGDTCNEDEDRCGHVPDDEACPDLDDCNLGFCDRATDCGIVPAPDGTLCDVVPEVDEICLAGICQERRCGDGWLDAGEECDTALHRLGCSDTCTTFDWVVSDEPGLAGDDGREELGPADRAVAVLDGGTAFVVAWTQDQDADPFYADVRARVLHVGEGLTSADILVTDLAFPQEHPVVAALPGNRFAVAWHGFGTDAGAEDVDVYLAVYAVAVMPPETPDGSPTVEVTLRHSTRVNTTVGEAQIHPTIAVAPGDDKIVVAWEDWSRDGEGPDPWNLSGIRYRLLNLDGTARTGWTADALVNTTTRGAQAEPAVAVLPTGEFVAAWSDGSQAAGDTDGSAVRARLFGPTGVPLCDDFVVNVGRTQWEQYEPTVAAVECPQPGFVVAWTSMEAGDGRLTVRANFVPDVGGVSPDTEVILPATVTDDQYAASVTSDVSDPLETVLAAVWVNESRGSPTFVDDSSTAIAGTMLSVVCPSTEACRPVPLGTDTLLNTTYLDTQETPSVAFGPDGALTLVWTDWSDGDRTGGLDEVRARYLPHGWVVE